MKSDSNYVKSYRARQSMRVDYYPAPDTASIIRHHHTHQTDGEKLWAGVVDMLIRAGHKALSGNNPTAAP